MSSPSFAFRIGVCACLAAVVLASPAVAQQKAPVEKLADGTYRIGDLRVDPASRTVVATGQINDVTILEFVANTKGGQKAYESAITLNTDAITFNTAMLLLGLDPKRAVVPKYHFDPTPPSGDEVEISVEVMTQRPQTRLDRPVETEKRTYRVEDLLFDQRTGKTLPEGPWVYTGSTFVTDQNGSRYMAEVDGVLIGFVHSPSPVIENPRKGAVDGYGFVVLNPALGLVAGSPVTLTIRALRPPGGRK